MANVIDSSLIAAAPWGDATDLENVIEPVKTCIHLGHK